MNKQSTERLLRMADKLDGVGPYDKPIPKELFNMDIWNVCQTAGCAIGHAAIDPWFKRRGLSLGPTDDSIGNYGLPNSWLERFFGKVLYSPTYDSNIGFFAVAEFFGIEYFEAELMFNNTNYKSNPQAKTVAKRIRRFVEKV